MDAEYGTMVSAKDASLLQDAELPNNTQDDQSSELSQLGNALWSYKTENKINGIRVDEESQQLPIDRDDLLSAAFVLQSYPRSLLLWLSPDDVEAIKTYDELLNRVYNGSVIIQDELKQYDQSKGKFLVWVRYDEVCYKLHPRFQYLREELR